MPPSPAIIKTASLLGARADAKQPGCVQKDVGAHNSLGRCKSLRDAHTLHARCRQTTAALDGQAGRGLVDMWAESAGVAASKAVVCVAAAAAGGESLGPRRGGGGGGARRRF